MFVKKKICSIKYIDKRMYVRYNRCMETSVRTICSYQMFGFINININYFLKRHPMTIPYHIIKKIDATTILMIYL